MFHVEQITVLLWAASISLGAAQLASAQDNAPALPAHQDTVLTLVLATSNEESTELIALGMQELLLCDDENASAYFTQALAIDEECSPLAYLGLYLAQSHAAAEDSPLDELKERVQDFAATPPEAFYISSLLLLTQNNVKQAQEEFTKRADRYRADMLSTCWAIQLLHYSDHGYNSEGEIRPLQQQARERAQKFYVAQPDNPLACYLRALVEESAPAISEEALQAGKKATDLLPDHPTVLHLYAHLLYRAGKIKEATEVFHQTYELATSQGKEMMSLQARLYESVALWSSGETKKALAIRRELNAIKIDSSTSAAKKSFLEWEAHTLPLRLLVLTDREPNPADITAAVRAALPQGAPQDDFHAKTVQSIEASLQGRIFLTRGRKKDALISLRKAEQLLGELEREQGTYLESHAHLRTYYVRMHDAARIAINATRAKLYSSTADVWETSAQEAAGQPTTAQLPPTVPVQQAAKP